MIKFSFQQMIAIFLFFLFGSVIFGISLRKLNQIERGNNRVAFRERPEFIFYDDISYRYPRRSIDINLPQINVSAPPTTASTPSSTTPDTSNDEAIAIALQEEFDRESRGGSGGGSGSGNPRRGRGMAYVEGGQGVAPGQPGYRGGIHTLNEPFTNNIEGYMNPSSPLSGSPF